MVDAKVKRPIEDSFICSKDLPASTHPLTMVPSTLIIQGLDWGMERLFNTLQCPKEWRIRFA